MIDKKDNKESILLTWFVLWMLILIILFQGLFSFRAVGDLGQPDWDYGIIRDVPGESPYATYKLLPNSQHIKGKKGK